jgi:HD superfamily phosphodiesterase
MTSKSTEEIGIRDWPEFIVRLFREAAPYLAVRGDLLHARISHQYAVALMNEEGGDRRIVEPAVILHDVGWSGLEPHQIKAAYGVKADSPEAERLNRIHESEGASTARRILTSLDYPPPLIDEITAIIARHDSGKETGSLEEGLVKDADKLWRFSQVGFKMEIERQGLNPREYYEFIEEHYRGWFFTSKALILAGSELEKRAEEFAHTLKKVYEETPKVV